MIHKWVLWITVYRVIFTWSYFCVWNLQLVLPYFFIYREIIWYIGVRPVLNWPADNESKRGKKKKGANISLYTILDMIGLDIHVHMTHMLIWLSLWHDYDFFMTELPNMKTHHGSHCIGGTPTQYLSTASASDDFSSSYVRSHRTLARYLRDLLSFWWRHAWRKQVMADTPSSVFLKWK